MNWVRWSFVDVESETTVLQAAASPVATSTPRRQANANPAPLWDQSFVEEEEDDHALKEAQVRFSVPAKCIQSTLHSVNVHSVNFAFSELRIQ